MVSPYELKIALNSLARRTWYLSCKHIRHHQHWRYNSLSHGLRQKSPSFQSVPWIILTILIPVFLSSFAASPIYLTLCLLNRVCLLVLHPEFLFESLVLPQGAHALLRVIHQSWILIVCMIYLILYLWLFAYPFIRLRDIYFPRNFSFSGISEPDVRLGNFGWNGWAQGPIHVDLLMCMMGSNELHRRNHTILNYISYFSSHILCR